MSRRRDTGATCPAPGVDHPPGELGEAVGLAEAAVDDGSEECEHERSSARGERRLAAQSRSEEAQAGEPFTAVVREPVRRVDGLELERRDTREGSRENREQLDVVEPDLGAVDRSTGEADDDVGDQDPGEDGPPPGSGKTTP